MKRDKCEGDAFLRSYPGNLCCHHELIMQDNCQGKVIFHTQFCTFLSFLFDMQCVLFVCHVIKLIKLMVMFAVAEILPSFLHFSSGGMACLIFLILSDILITYYQLEYFQGVKHNFEEKKILLGWVNLTCLSFNGPSPAVWVFARGKNFIPALTCDMIEKSF